jgi:hypothetical protein
MGPSLVLAVAAAFGPLFPCPRAIDSGVIRVRLPDEDVTALYVEQAPSFTVALRAKDASVEATRFYVGDGVLAVVIWATGSEGIIFQGTKMISGSVFKKGSTVKVLPGYKQAADLTPGTVYVELPGVKFEVSENE